MLVRMSADSRVEDCEAREGALLLVAAADARAMYDCLDVMGPAFF
jgi:hypothetical protein